MCRSSLHSWLVALPKCELHMHLEGSLEPELLYTLAKRNGISLPTQQEDPAFASVSALMDRYSNFDSLDDFLHYYFIGMSCLIQEKDFEDLAWAYFRRASQEGVVHAEVFFDPQAHTERGVPYQIVVNGFKRACYRAEAELDMTTGLILCFLRHLPVQSAEMVWEGARDDLRSGLLSGIGLDSSECGYRPKLWQDIFLDAQKQGIKRTAHAGEEGPASYIREALHDCNVQRIDHGIKLIDDSALMKEMSERKILVTVCPISNFKLKCVRNVADLPILQFLESGVQFCINSDDPAYFGGYIQDNYCAIQDAFDLSEAQWLRIARASVKGSWCNEQRKQQILEAIDALQIHS